MLHLQTVKVTGPSSIVENIDKVKAVCDISGAYSNVNSTAKLTAYAADGSQINEERFFIFKKRCRLYSTDKCPIR